MCFFSNFPPLSLFNAPMWLVQVYKLEQKKTYKIIYIFSLSEFSSSLRQFNKAFITVAVGRFSLAVY